MRSKNEARRILSALREVADVAGLIQGHVYPVRVLIETDAGETESWRIDTLRMIVEQAIIMGVSAADIESLSD